MVDSAFQTGVALLLVCLPASLLCWGFMIGFAGVYPPPRSQPLWMKAISQFDMTWPLRPQPGYMFGTAFVFLFFNFAPAYILVLNPFGWPSFALDLGYIAVQAYLVGPTLWRATKEFRAKRKAGS